MMVEIYIVRRNSDLTEGKGHSVINGYYLTEEQALKNNKGIDVMGSDGTVHKLVVLDSEYYEELVWGYRKNRQNEWGYGFVDNRDSPDPNDPEYKQYLELKEKFEGA